MAFPGNKRTALTPLMHTYCLDSKEPRSHHALVHAHGPQGPNTSASAPTHHLQLDRAYLQHHTPPATCSEEVVIIRQGLHSTQHACSCYQTDTLDM